MHINGRSRCFDLGEHSFIMVLKKTKAIPSRVCLFSKVSYFIALSAKKYRALYYTPCQLLKSSQVNLK